MGQVKTEILHDPILLHAHPDIVTVHVDQTIGQAIEEIRRQKVDDRIVYFYVLDREERLTGVIPVRRLLTGDAAQTVRSIMIKPVISVPRTATVLEASEIFLRRRLLALPVVDEENRPVGVVDIKLFTEEITSLAEQHQVDNAFQTIGVHVELGRRVPPWVSVRDRFPWLLSNITSGIICALIAARFENLIEAFTILALFLTVVLALAESVSMQSMTITLQGLARQPGPLTQLLRTLGQELATAAMLGAACGVLVGGIALIWRREMVAALAIGGSIWVTIIAAALLGIIIPTTIRALKADPKVAAGPIVLASADVITVLSYFTLATWLLRQ